MRISVKNVILMMLMVASAGLAWAARPTNLIADQRSKVDLGSLVPINFKDWKEVKQSTSQIINPQESTLINKLYSQTLSRTYVNKNGINIMLSIAYGENQSDGIALHYPEVCYPAQGFQILENTKISIKTDFGSIAAKQLMTRLGNRFEPVTYWSTLGDKVVEGGIKTKLIQLGYGFKGLIPDGLILRISSINNEASKGHDDQENFTRDLVTALTIDSRRRLTGLGN
jgi:EpsI family protein